MMRRTTIRGLARPCTTTSLTRVLVALSLLTLLAGCEPVGAEVDRVSGAATVALEFDAYTVAAEPQSVDVQSERGERAFRERKLTFEGDGETLHGTLIAPDEEGPHTGVVLLGGSGPETREQNRPLAEAFANSGIAAFIYDKRTRGYSADPTGERSYALLAHDAHAAAEMLRTLDSVDADFVGVWGVSEGAWVAPLAANRSDAIAFVVTMSAIGIAPAAQVAWSVGRALDHRGIHARSMHRALTDRVPSFIVSAEMMSEAAYDPVGAIEQLTQPYLALWGDRDAVQPTFESVRIIGDALRSSDHRSHTLVILEHTDHNGYPTDDGFSRTSRDFAPGYVETMVEWIEDVTDGEPPASSVDRISAAVAPAPENGFSSQSARPAPAFTAPAPDVLDPSGYDHWYVQVASMGMFVVGFLGYGVVGLLRWTKARVRRRGHATLGAHVAPRRYARILSAGGTVLWMYALYYIFSVFIESTAIGSRDIASIIVAGRTGGWLLLQLGSVALVACTVLLARSVWRERRQIRRTEMVRLALVLLAALAFIPWAIHWQLLAP